MELEIWNCATCGSGAYIYKHQLFEFWVIQCNGDCWEGRHMSPTLNGAIQLWNEAQEETENGKQNQTN